MNGHLSTWLFCDCLICGTRVDVTYAGPERAEAMRELWRLGWRRNPFDQSWLCPNCKMPKARRLPRATA